MSDKDETSQDAKTESVERSQEPQAEKPKVDPAVAAGEAAARKYEPTPKPVEGKSYSAEDVQKMIESQTSKAVNEALEKQAAKFKEQHQAGDYMTREEVQEAMSQERERAKAAVKAQENFINEAARLGITPGSEGYQKLTETFNAKLEAGTLQPEALMDPDMIKALAYASGAIESQPKQDNSYIDLTDHGRFSGMKDEDIPDYARVDLEVDKRVKAALRGQGLA